MREAFPQATIFKPASMVGVEDRLFNNIAQLAKALPLFPLIDGGAKKLQPVWIRDVTDAIIASLNLRDTLGKTYHLAGPEVFTCVPSASSRGTVLVWKCQTYSGRACTFGDAKQAARGL